MVDVTLAEVARELTNAGRVLVTSHPNPDGDALGSTMGAYWLLKALGKEAVAYNPDPVPQVFRFLRGVDRIVRLVPPEHSFDVTLVLDCSDTRMFPQGPPPRERLGRVVVVDHHKTRGDFGDVIYCDVDAAAVGVLVYRLAAELGVTLTPAMAEPIYCSILSDTGSFRYQNTNPESLAIAGALLGLGVEPWRVASNLYETRPREQLELLALVLQTLRVSDDGLTAALTVTPEMLERTSCNADMVDGFVNYARGLQGVEVAILFRPTNDAVRVSMRSRGAVDVSAVAQQLGGGGHHNAAGCTVEATDVDTLWRRLARQVRDMIV